MYVCYHSSIGFYGKRTRVVRYFLCKGGVAVSDLLFPTLRGLTYPIGKTPCWNTIVQESISGVKKFLQCYTYPYYTLTLSFSYLSDRNIMMDDIHTLMSFYNQLGGAGQDFLFADPLFEDKSSRLIEEGFGKRIPIPVEGAILLFQNVCGMKNHIGIYMGDGLFAHCNIEGSKMERLCDWKDKLGGIYLWQKL